jgi:hypothetical protein
MTRETKVGVAVACSFLGLVAAVVVLRLGGTGTPASDEQVVQAKPDAPTAVPSGSAGKPGETEVLQAIHLQPGAPVLPASNDAASNKGQNSQQNLGGVPQPPPPVAQPETIMAPPPPPAASSSPLVKPAPKESSPIVSPPSGELNKKNPQPPPVVADTVEAAVPALPSAVKNTSPAPVADNKKPASEDDDHKKLEELARQAALAGQEKTPTKASSPPPDAVGKAPPKNESPENTKVAQGNDLLPPAPVPVPSPLANSGPTAPAPPGNLAPAVPESPLKSPATPVAPEVAIKLPPKPLEVPAPPVSSTPKPAESPAVAMGPRASDNLQGELSRQKDPLAEATARPPQPAPQPAAPVGAPPGASSAPIAVPMPPSPASSNPPATVRSWDAVSYSVKSGESSFADLSKRFYHSEKYAQPLLLYNREYNPAAADLRADPPRLQVGQPILVPPTYILELPRYAAGPAATKPPAPQDTRPPEPVVALAPRPPAAAPPSSTPSPLPTTPTKPASAPGSRTYLVRGNGEMLFEIARQTLGDGRRWSEIYRLNPDIRPELAIPGGTQLRLPADARVGS